VEIFSSHSGHFKLVPYHDKKSRDDAVTFNGTVTYNLAWRKAKMNFTVAFRSVNGFLYGATCGIYSPRWLLLRLQPRSPAVFSLTIIHPSYYSRMRINISAYCALNILSTCSSGLLYKCELIFKQSGL